MIRFYLLEIRWHLSPSMGKDQNEQLMYFIYMHYVHMQISVLFLRAVELHLCPNSSALHVGDDGEVNWNDTQQSAYLRQG